MGCFGAGGVEIHYTDEGNGDPVLLVHGFASDIQMNWRETNWFSTLKSAGFRVVALDCRGHGLSEKLYEPKDYSSEAMGSDVLALMDHLEIDCCHLMGYSMGAILSLHLALGNESRFESLILGGIGDNVLRQGRGDREDIARALEADALDDVTHPVGREFRAFAQRQKGDLNALAACIRSERSNFSTDRLAKLSLPVLVVAGERDVLTGDAYALAACFPNGQTVIVPRRDHMKTVADRVYKEAVLDFLAR
jgi:pimeloyl-ACP methyl ester carboxylesterase